MHQLMTRPVLLSETLYDWLSVWVWSMRTTWWPSVAFISKELSKLRNSCSVAIVISTGPLVAVMFTTKDSLMVRQVNISHATSDKQQAAIMIAVYTSSWPDQYFYCIQLGLHSSQCGCGQWEQHGASRSHPTTITIPSGEWKHTTSLASSPVLCISI